MAVTEDDSAQINQAIAQLAALDGVTDLVLMYVVDGQEHIEVHASLSTAAYLQIALGDEIVQARRDAQNSARWLRGEGVN